MTRHQNSDAAGGWPAHKSEFCLAMSALPALLSTRLEELTDLERSTPEVIQSYSIFFAKSSLHEHLERLEKSRKELICWSNH
jgi:hypothetical protein